MNSAQGGVGRHTRCRTLGSGVGVSWHRSRALVAPRLGPPAADQLRDLYGCSHGEGECPDPKARTGTGGGALHHGEDITPQEDGEESRNDPSEGDPSPGQSHCHRASDESQQSVWLRQSQAASAIVRYPRKHHRQHPDGDRPDGQTGRRGVVGDDDPLEI